MFKLRNVETDHERYSDKNNGQDSTSIGFENSTKDKASTNIACKLTNEALKHRKETVLYKLKSIMIEKKETETGYAFKFPGTDDVLDDLLEFIKSERTCCDFFTFELSVSGEKTAIWMTMSGAEGVKSFIEEELGF